MFRGATGTIYSPVEGLAPRGGGQAELFKVRAPRGGLFAVKRARTPSDNARLRRELEHIDELYKGSPACASWLVEVLDRGEHEGRAFFVMRWHESSLEDWMRAAAWPLGARLKQAAALCRLVERFFAVAGSRIVHHDIKPANILLDDRAAEGLLLADLAGSRGLAGPHRSSSVGVMTATYAPPELALPHGRQASVQVDRFSTAVTVYELITGARPLRAAPQLWTDEGMALWSLYQQRLAGEELDEHEEAELTRLSARPLSLLMRRDGALLIGNFDRKLTETLGSGPLVPPLTSSLRSMLSALPEERLSPPAALVPLLEALTVEVGAAAGPAAPLTRGEVPSVRVGGSEARAANQPGIRLGSESPRPSATTEPDTVIEAPKPGQVGINGPSRRATSEPRDHPEPGSSQPVREAPILTVRGESVGGSPHSASAKVAAAETARVDSSASKSVTQTETQHTVTAIQTKALSTEGTARSVSPPIGCAVLWLVVLMVGTLGKIKEDYEEEARGDQQEPERERRRALEAKGTWNDAPSGPRRVDGDLVWVEVPAGRGQIGNDIEGQDDEKPSFLVEFSASFDMLETEITNRQFARLVSGHQPVNDEPVVTVTWDKAKDWCVSAGGRLPTELEWEYAARAGGGGPYGRGQGGEVVTEANLSRYAWFNPTNDAQPVRQKVSNAWGLYDLWGNVWEWTLDGYEDSAWKQLQARGARSDTSDKFVITDPGFVDTIDNAPPDHRVLRGGSAWFGPRDLRSGDRYGLTPSVSVEVLGFRCVRGPTRRALNLDN